MPKGGRRVNSESSDIMFSGMYFSSSLIFQAMLLTCVSLGCRELGKSLAHALGRGTNICLALGVMVPWGEIWAEW